MRRFTLVSSLIVAITSSACTDAGRSLIIVQNQVPDNGCIVSDSESNSFRGVGFLDINSPSGYLFFPLVKNVAVGEREDPSRHVVSMRGADVSLDFQEGVLPDPAPDAIAANQKLTVLFAGPVEPDGDTTGFAFEAVTKNMMNAIKDLGVLNVDGSNFFTMIATISVFGDMDGGSVESEEFTYPIQVCDGCLKEDLGSCEALPTGFAAAQGFECPGLLQDALIQCCTTAGGIELCPATQVSGSN